MCRPQLCRSELRRDKRPGLGTGFGERVSSPVEEVVFYRHNPVTPALVLGVRYNDRSGLIAMGVDVDGDGAAMSGRLRYPDGGGASWEGELIRPGTARWPVRPAELRSQGRHTPFAFDASAMELPGAVRYTLVAGQIAHAAAGP